MPDNDQKRLFLLDAYALIFRAYYAFIKNPRITSKGVNTSAIFGFLLALEEILHKQKPTHIAVVFDHPSPTFRHEMFSEYKATRNDTPEDIKSAIPWIKQVLEGYRIPIFDCPGFEADDIIGTLARKATERGYTTFMMTPDKDFAQLVTDKVFIVKPSRGAVESVIWGVEDVKREFCVNAPEQVIDVLALMGDTSDNIPGAPGIGPKTAMKLISEFGSVEELLKNTDKVKGKCREILETHKEQIEFSKKLVRIDQNAPVELREEYLELRQPDPEKLKPLFEELEFKSISTKLFGDQEKSRIPEKTIFSAPADSMQGTLFGSDEEATAPKDLKTIENVPHDYRIISDAELREFAARLRGLKEFCFDTETTSVNSLDTELVAISFAWEPGKGFLVHFPAEREKTAEMLEILRPVFEDPSIRKTGQNMKFDIQVLACYGIEVKGPIFDTLIAHYLLEPDMRHNMNLLSELYLSYSPVHIESLIGEKGPAQKTMRSVPIEKIKEYSVEDADVTIQLKKIFEPEIILQGLDDLAEKIEMPLIKVLAAMERYGVKLDLEDLKNIMGDLREDIIRLEKEIYELAGTEFNISSPKQLGDILFIKLKLDEKARMTKTKQFITSEEILQRLTTRHPIVEKVLDYRGLKKLLTTYVEALPQLVDPKTGRIHTCFNQAVAATGRLSSNNPNLQNIPIRDERGRQIRKAFVPEKGYIFLSADYSQIELRLMAHLSRDQSMIDDFLSGNDIHAATASKIFGVDIKDVTREMRSRAKTANFGIIYGISSFGLAERLTIGRKEAKELIDGYFNSYPGVKLYMEESVRAARELGYVKTMFGRRRYLRDIHSRNQVVRGMAERNAINAPIQGTAADIIKIAMVRIFERMQEEKYLSKMILQVHDELIFEMYEPEFERLKDMVLHEMSHAVKLDVPLVAEWGRGNSWFEAH
ncbi:MAG TPA: DNA polymerase I [Bacteroidales bacterium]|nr:DNA polymerase I [Bacteroidales bacterium]